MMAEGLGDGRAWGESAEELRHPPFGIRRREEYRALFVVRRAVMKIPYVRAPDGKPVSRDELESQGKLTYTPPNNKLPALQPGIAVSD